MTEFVPIAAIAPAHVEQLLDTAFGTDRHGRTAYRIRQGMVAIPQLSFAARDGDALIGTIQCWPIRFAADSGADVPMVQVGPVAVNPTRGSKRASGEC